MSGQISTRAPWFYKSVSFKKKVYFQLFNYIYQYDELNVKVIQLKAIPDLDLNCTHSYYGKLFTHNDMLCIANNGFINLMLYQLNVEAHQLIQLQALTKPICFFNVKDKVFAVTESNISLFGSDSLSSLNKLEQVSSPRILRSAQQKWKIVRENYLHIQVADTTLI